MGKGVKYRVDRGVAVITVRNPPVNALSHGVRAGLVAAVERAEADAQVCAIVIKADGRTFPAGADIREFGKPPQAPLLPEVCNRIEAASKPVVAALHGTALGGGFELALAAHYRVAHSTAKVGLPEVTLGLVPGAGGTQRAPRICGAAAALDLMLSGRPISAHEARATGLIDAVARADLYSAAIDYASMVADLGVRLRPSRARREGLMDPVAYEATIASKRQALAGSPLIAPAKIIDCVEAALLLPFDAGLALERAAFQDCMATDQSAALRHVFFAERAAAKVPELDSAETHKIDIAGVVGGGTMGSGIAVSMLDAGLAVVMIERDVDTLKDGVARVKAIYDRALDRGRITSRERDERMGRLLASLDYSDLRGADLVIEAVIEDMGAKVAVFAQLDAVLKPGAILASNTSYLDIDKLAETTSRPSDVLGLHFFAPANIMKLLEIVVGEKTAADVVATGFALAKKLGKVAVRAGVCDGFIGNRILLAYRRAAELMVEDGASPYEIDAAMRTYGFRLGPFQVSDLAGLDIAWAQRKRRAASRDPGARYVAIADKLCERGWFGQKTGRGYYRYPDGQRRGVEDEQVLRLVAAEREEKGIVPRQFRREEIQRRCLAAMANTGAKLIEEGIALRPSDIDVVMIHGYGFPRWRGGPMMAADLAGLLAVQNDLTSFAPDDPGLWTPAPLFGELIRNGQGFGSLNRG